MTIVYRSVKGAALTSAEVDNNFEELEDAVTNIVSDTVYGVGWDGVTGVAPSKNAVYDLSLLLLPLDGSRSMTASIPFTAGNKGLTWTGGSYLKDDTGSVVLFANSSLELQTPGLLTIGSTADETAITSGANISLSPASGSAVVITRGTRLSYATASTVVYLDASKNLVSLANGAGVLTNDGSGGLSWVAGGGGGVTTVSGTTNRITSTGGSTPVIDISASYVGQSSITTLGTITTGVWSGTAVAVGKGGNGLTTVASGSVLGYNALDTASAITSTSGLKVLQNSAGTVSWASTTGTVNAVYSTAPTLTGAVIIDTSGTLTVASDTDGTTILGRAKLGTPTSDVMHIAHFDQLASTTYALKQSAAGVTTLNGITGQTLRLAVANAIILQVGTTALTVADAVNFVYDTTTGTKHGTATSQKLSFWNATPIIQPVNTTAIDTLLVNTGLRASGGTANFDTVISLLDTTYKTVLDVNASTKVRIGNGFSELYVAPTLLRFSGGTTAMTVINAGADLAIQTIGQSSPATVSLGALQSITNTTGTYRLATLSGVFVPTTGTGALTGLSLDAMTVNQTSTASGTVTGININPVLTSVKGLLYGLRSQIADAPTGGGTAWNLYIDGTASNVIVGKTTHGSTTAPTSFVSIAAGVTANAQINLAPGVAPSSPVDGDIYYINTSDRLMFYKNATACEVISASAVTTEALVSDTTLTITYNGTTYKLLARA